MESNKEQEELMEELLMVEVMAKENPCGMPKSVMQSLKSVLHDFIGKHCVEGASKEQVARYFRKDVRTVTRWKSEYPDFPNGKTTGKNAHEYCWMDIIRWKLKHRELFE